jgi:hypothetical protein
MHYLLAGVDNTREQGKLEARKMLENGDESLPSSERCVSLFLNLRDACFTFINSQHLGKNISIGILISAPQLSHINPPNKSWLTFLGAL